LDKCPIKPCDKEKCGWWDKRIGVCGYDWEHGEYCPKCGASLLKNNYDVECSFTGCDYSKKFE
jgi:hypothetical protein